MNSAAVGIIPILVMMSTGCSLVGGHRGRALDTWEVSSDGLHIRVRAFEERGVLLSGTYFVFESKSNGQEYNDIMTFRHDDRPAIPRENIRFLSDGKAYMFMGWIYVATTDGGESWHVWNAGRELPKWKQNYRLIESVDIAPDGNGTMRLRPTEGSLSLYTNDYGFHWYSK